MDPDTSREYAEMARIMDLTKICQLSAFVVVLYDHVLTIGAEVKFVWKRHMTPIGWVYMVMRYLGDVLAVVSIAGTFFPDPSLKLCQAFFPSVHAVAVLLGGVFQFVLLLRVYALYEKSKKILRFLVAVFCIEAVVVFVELGLGSGGVALTNEPLPGLRGCILTANPPMYYLEFWGPIIIYETLLCVLVLRAGWIHARAEYQGARLPVGRIVRTLIRDNVLYFFCFLFVCLVNVVMWAKLPASWSDMPEGFVPATDIVLSCRLIINTWESVRGGPQRIGDGDDSGGTHELTTMATMQFSDDKEHLHPSSINRDRRGHGHKRSLTQTSFTAAKPRISMDSAYTRIEERTLVERDRSRSSLGLKFGDGDTKGKDKEMGIGMELVEEQEEPVYTLPDIVVPRANGPIHSVPPGRGYVGHGGHVGRTGERTLSEDSVASGQHGFSSLAVEEGDRYYPPDSVTACPMGARAGVRPLPNPGVRPLPNPNPRIRPLPDPGIPTAVGAVTGAEAGMGTWAESGTGRRERTFNDDEELMGME